MRDELLMIFYGIKDFGEMMVLYFPCSLASCSRIENWAKKNVLSP
jgi:hypothetical protein